MTQSNGTPLACPTCRWRLARDAEGWRCAPCGAGYPIRDGIACFSSADTFYGELTEPEMAEFEALAERTHWAEAVAAYLPGRNPGLVETITSPRRAAWLPLIDLDRRDRALDYGCGLGGVTVPLARAFRSVVGLDGTWRRVRFLQIRRAQDRLGNIDLVCNGDVLHLPFEDGAFDLVVLNMVFPYLHAMLPSMRGRDADLAVLAEVRRVVRAGGCLYLTVRNRYDYRRLRHLWRRLLGRPEAETADNFTCHGHRYYRRLLDAAGFRRVRSYWLVPNYKFPEHMIPLDAGPRAAVRAIDRIEAFRARKRRLVSAAAAARVLRYLVETYAFVAA